jgi:murein DD-endopeptidase MepM/ murein hydrolase activator NlpD
MPVSTTTTIPTTGYGEARSYNSGPYDSFHSGTDFAGYTGTPIYAPANAIVHFADAMTVRGNVVILDHGLGVMTGYFHLSAIHVQTGDTITTGQLIGDIGTTGLSTGPHLHWDLRIFNQAVNPLLWTTQTFP